MEFTVKLELGLSPELLAVLKAFTAHAPVVSAPAPKVETAAQKAEEKKVELLAALKAEEKKTAAPEDAGQETSGVDQRYEAALAKFKSDWKPATTGTGKGGVQFRIGDDVVNEDGEPAVIEALARGRAFVLFEDGTGIEVVTATLSPRTMMPAEAEEEAEEEEEVEPQEEEDDAAGMLDEEPVEEITRVMLHGKLQEMINRGASSKAYSILTEIGGAKKLGAVPEAQFGAMYTALNLALAALPAEAA